MKNPNYDAGSATRASLSLSLSLSLKLALDPSYLRRNALFASASLSEPHQRCINYDAAFIGTGADLSNNVGLMITGLLGMRRLVEFHLADLFPLFSPFFPRHFPRHYLRRESSRATGISMGISTGPLSRDASIPCVIYLGY